MSIRKKTLIIISATFFFLIGLLIAISNIVVMGSFYELENNNTRLNVIRTMSELANILSNINTSLGDWAPWDETYNFINDGNQAFIKANLQDSTIVNLKLNFMIFLNDEGKIVYIKCVDLNEGKEVMVFDGLMEQIYANKDALQNLTPKTSKTGIIMFSEKPVFVASQPILKTDYQGTARGSLIFGRFLNNDEIKRMESLTNLSLSIQPYNDPNMPKDFLEAKEAFLNGVNIHIKPIDSQLIGGYALQKDISGKPAFILKIIIPRKIFSQGKRTFLYYIFSLLIVAIVVIILIMLFLEKMVLSPVSRLSEKAIQIGKQGSFTERIPITTEDEIGKLTLAINIMLDQLSEARKKISEQSYRSGMAEMAAGVLHNVRNSLTPLIGNIDFFKTKLLSIPIDAIEKACLEFENNTAYGERKEELIRFSFLMNRTLYNFIKETQIKLDKAMERIHHIENILDSHQAWAHTEIYPEPVNLGELIHDAIHLMRDDHKKMISFQLDMDKELQAKGPVMTFRMILIQIISNILLNSAESIQRFGLDHGNISIRIKQELKNDKEMIHIEIQDNGEGIEADQISHVFERGYSTKKRASGVGLHWCANALASMKGSIEVESKGKGKGACFHIYLPSVFQNDK